jgi:ribosomal protein S18 acetylase RimI-like enzyme
MAVMKSKLASIRVASAEDREAMAGLINSAFAIETFLLGPRTTVDELSEFMRKGNFLLARDAAGKLLASVYVESRGARGYLGMLAVDPSQQGSGMGRLMVDAAEQFCRNQGCRAIDLTILSLRPELPPFYRRLGYRETGTQEFHPLRPLKDSMDCHCIVMSKSLRIRAML